MLRDCHMDKGNDTPISQEGSPAKLEDNKISLHIKMQLYNQQKQEDNTKFSLNLFLTSGLLKQQFTTTLLLFLCQNLDLS